jgi:hypothetical protein
MLREAKKTLPAKQPGREEKAAQRDPKGRGGSDQDKKGGKQWLAKITNKRLTPKSQQETRP